MHRPRGRFTFICKLDTEQTPQAFVVTAVLSGAPAALPGIVPVGKPVLSELADDSSDDVVFCPTKFSYYPYLCLNCSVTIAPRLFPCERFVSWLQTGVLTVRGYVMSAHPAAHAVQFGYGGVGIYLVITESGCSASVVIPP